MKKMESTNYENNEHCECSNSKDEICIIYKQSYNFKCNCDFYINRKIATI